MQPNNIDFVQLAKLVASKAPEADGVIGKAQQMMQDSNTTTDMVMNMLEGINPRYTQEIRNNPMKRQVWESMRGKSPNGIIEFVLNTAKSLGLIRG